MADPPIPPQSVTSLAHENGSAPPLDDVAPIVAAAFAAHFGLVPP